jgi:phage terminase large subunit-like protein
MSRKRQKTPTSTEVDQATAYAAAVVAGDVVAGPHVRDACDRHLRDLEDGAERGLTWDVAAAEKAIGFFRDVLRLNGGRFEGLPFVLNGWQCFVLGSLFGWKRADGTRRFRTAYIETGKGSGKSPLAAGIGLLLLCADGEARAEVYAGASKHDQAKVLFRDAAAMVQLSPTLAKRLHMSGGAIPDNIAHMASSSFFRPISSQRQGRGQSGPRPHGVLLDEIHEHSSGAMVEFLSAGVKARRQPMIVMITNSGSDKASVCWEYHAYAVQIGDGTKENDEFFSYVCALDKGDDPFTSEACWIKANPSLPVIPTVDYIRGEVAKARGLPSKESLVRRLNFCQWTDAAESWITKAVWERAQASLKLEEYAGRECYGGLDLSLASDLTALCLAFPTAHRTWDVFSWFWMPGDRLLELEQRDHMDPWFRTWRDAGHLQAPAGRTIDYEHAANLIAELCARFDVKGIAYDRHRMELLRAPLDAIGCTVPLVEHGQGFYKAKESGLWMPGSIAELEAALVDGRIRVNVNPVLSWCVASAVTQASTIVPTDRYFSKRKASARIDGAVALAMSIGLATMRPVEKPQPQYQFLVFGGAR